ncbi:MAG: ABC transporter ATP-binding protein/permease, partial [Acidobacteriota bacterium]|nr:ABC transporter ATP-binding protein/permease [Acidobacteriota bacterium]
TLVVSSNAQDRESGRFQRLNDRFIEALMGMQRLSYLAGGLPGLLLSLGASAVFLYGGWRVVEGSLTLGTFAAFIAYQMRVMAPVQALMGLYAALATARVSWRRVLELLDAPVDVQEAPGARPLTEVRGGLSFEHVSLTTERGVAVLDDVSVEVAPGSSVAIVGASGSGKSTIAALVLRLIDPDRGTVRLDGHDLRSLRLADVRRHIVLVEQDPTLLHATIAENLRYGLADGGAEGGVTGDTGAAIRRAAEAAGVAAFIDSLPQKYDTVVGERGLQLSAGERQRLALARAFLANPSVLVLDEPTAALDPISERAVVEGYRAVMRGRTTLIISHRRDVAMAADRAIVLDGARIVQSGRPAELMKEPGVFARLFAAPVHEVTREGTVAVEEGDGR